MKGGGGDSNSRETAAFASLNQRRTGGADRVDVYERARSTRRNRWSMCRHDVRHERRPRCADGSSLGACTRWRSDGSIMQLYILFSSSRRGAMRGVWRSVRREAMRGEPPAVYGLIAPTFERLAKQADADPNRPSIEFYRRRDVIDLLLPVTCSHLSCRFSTQARCRRTRETGRRRRSPGAQRSGSSSLRRITTSVPYRLTVPTSSSISHASGRRPTST